MKYFLIFALIYSFTTYGEEITKKVDQVNSKIKKTFKEMKLGK